MDTGGACTIMDISFAKRLQLPVKLQTCGEFGTFIVPGRTLPHPYPGIIKGPLQLHFDDEVMVTLPHVLLIAHGKPIFILGADVLSHQGGHDEWSFDSLGPGKMKGKRATQGWLRFIKGTRERYVPLISAPVVGQTYVRPADSEQPHVGSASPHVWRIPQCV